MAFPGAAGSVAWRTVRVRVQPVCSDYGDLTARWGVGSPCRRVSARFLRLAKRQAKHEVSFLPPRRWQAFAGSAAPGMGLWVERRTVRLFLAGERFAILSKPVSPCRQRRRSLHP